MQNMATCGWSSHAIESDQVKGCQQLLIAVKSTVERLLATHLPNVWKTYGGLSRLSKDVEQIFNHGLRTSNGICDYWQFLLGLRVLLPTLAPVIEKHRVTMEAQGVKSLGRGWILQSLEEHTLSTHLQILLRDKNHLRTCYEDNAFLLQDVYVEAFLLCLQAIDQNDLVLLTELNPELLVKPSQLVHQTHTRSSSFPLNQNSLIDSRETCPPAGCLNNRKHSYGEESYKCSHCDRKISNRQLRRTISGEHEVLQHRNHLRSNINCCCSDRIHNDFESVHKTLRQVSSNVEITNDLNLYQKNVFNSVPHSLSSNNSVERFNFDICDNVKKTDSLQTNLNTDEKSSESANDNENNLSKSIQLEKELDLKKNMPMQTLSDTVDSDIIRDHSDVLLSAQQELQKSCSVDNNFSSTVCSALQDHRDLNNKPVAENSRHSVCKISSRKRFQSGPVYLSSHSGDLSFVNNGCSNLNNSELSEVIFNSIKKSYIPNISFRSHSDSDLNSLLLKSSFNCHDCDSENNILKNGASVLKIDYGNETFLTSSINEVEGDVSKPQDKKSNIHKANEKVSDDAASTNTIQAASDATTGSDNWECDLGNSFQKSDTLSCTTHTSGNSDDVGKVQLNTVNNSNPPRLTHQRSRSDDITYYGQDDRLSSLQVYPNLKNSQTFPKPRRKSLLEEGGRSVLPMTECFFPQPLEGQSLTSFLSSQDFHTCAELDKENHHFSISEALIAAIEQIKWNEMMKTKTSVREDDEEDSDEEIQHLKQRIRIRRRERQQEKAQKTIHLLSDGRTDTTTSQSASPFSSPHSSLDYPDSSSSDSVDELVLSGDEADTCNQLVALRDQGLSLSMASLYSDADIHRGNAGFPPNKSLLLPSHEKNSSICESLCSNISAESVALSLLKRFTEKQLPKASELVWLVSEQDAPQRLLPLPTSWPVSPDETDQAKLRLRGNSEWAPPRPQVIFNIHPPPKRKVAIAKQNYRCAGCGMKTEIGYIKRFRYCEYLGKYFCQCCHTNYRTNIPGRILRKWDFSKYYVSDFSKKTLETMFYDPLFNVEDVNPGLYRRSQDLENVRNFRQQLYYLKNYVDTCRSCESLQVEFKQLPVHLYTDIHAYSVNDLLQVKSREMSEKLKQLVNKTIAHVNNCQLCQAKGFICEFCNNGQDIIFPFQIQKILQCHNCGACYHKNCFSNNNCPKCKRIDERRRRMSQQDDENSDTY